jgi:glycosyltransferase involved in cell wall biosynthesis
VRITFVIPFANLSGGIKVVAIYAERLRRRGHQVVVVSQPWRSPDWRSQIRTLLRERRWLDRRPHPQSHFDGLAVDHRVIDRERPLTNADLPDADVLVATWWRTAGWIDSIGPEKGVQSILIQGYEVLPGEANAELDAVWRLPLRKIVIARWLKRLAEERFGDPGAILVPNAVDRAQFYAPERTKQSRPTLGFLYSASPFKGVDLAVQAIARIRERVPDLKVISFGTGNPEPRCPLPPGCEYHLLPAQDAIRTLYAKCDLWLCASRREGFHLPPLEAMACRCPVVSTRVGGPEEVVRPGVNGDLVEIGDVEGLANAACRILQANPDTWRAYSDAAMAEASRYTWDDAAVLLEEGLTRIAKGEVPAAGSRTTPGAQVKST